MELSAITSWIRIDVTKYTAFLRSLLFLRLTLCPLSSGSGEFERRDLVFDVNALDASIGKGRLGIVLLKECLKFRTHPVRDRT